jgi:hypothetical protein
MVRVAAEDERLALAAPGALEIGDRILCAIAAVAAPDSKASARASDFIGTPWLRRDA